MINLDACPFCGAEVAKEGASLHCWSIGYDCGTEIAGAIGESDFQVQNM